jgi:hypothetical protein
VLCLKEVLPTIHDQRPLTEEIIWSENYKQRLDPFELRTHTYFFGEFVPNVFP